MTKCQKQHSYPTKRMALRAMRRVPPTAMGKIPTRVYWCGQHKAYHYTSQVKEGHRR